MRREERGRGRGWGLEFGFSGEGGGARSKKQLENWASVIRGEPQRASGDLVDFSCLS